MSHTRLFNSAQSTKRGFSEFDSTYSVYNIVEDVKLYQKKLLDHLERMDRSHLLKLAFQYEPQGRQDMGRPRQRWRD
jgi:predicted ArsR family transcriptional regulator